MTPILSVAGTPMLGIVGWKSSGKTTLIARLLEELTRRGYRVATIKHAHHTVDVDGADTDSARHRRAGAGQVAVVSPGRWAVVTELRGTPEPSLEDVARRLDPCDLILVEGYKSVPIRKIEVRRATAGGGPPIAADDAFVVAIAADQPVADTTLPIFSLDDAGAIATFIETTALRVAARPDSPVRASRRINE